MSAITAASMAQLIEIDDKARLAAFFAQDLPLHIYELGDLDDFYWPNTTWFGWERRGELCAVALLYVGTNMPTLLLLERNCPSESIALLDAISPHLPDRYYAHLSPGLQTQLADHCLTPHGRHLKMCLTAPERIHAVDWAVDRAVDRAIGAVDVEPLDMSHREELTAFYQSSYPGHWFLPRMLQTGQYFAIRTGDSLVAAAGVHVYSPKYAVAALGNIATRPDARGQGFARRVIARLCQSLLEHTSTIGLNVHADNQPALHCYRTLGFEVVAEYDEFAVAGL